MEVEKVIYSGSTWVIPILIAITFHEAAHAYAAWRLGDDTALRAGRVTFNPLKHVDAFGTIVVPALLLVAGSPFLFGWAKPVPVAFNRLTRPRRDMALVAVAGPLTNVMLAFASAMLLHLVWLARPRPDHTVAGADALPIARAEPRAGDLQPAPDPATRRESDPPERDARCAGETICEAGALRLAACWGSSLLFRWRPGSSVLI